MNIRLELIRTPTVVFVSICVFAVTSASAQPAAPAPSARGGPAAPQTDLILGPAALPPGMIDRTCGTGPAGLAAWGTERIEQSMSFSGAQRDRFNDLKAASAKAVQYLRESCPTNEPVTPTGRLDVMQQRLEAMLEAVRTVRPALDDFYATLSDEQKARLNIVDRTNDERANDAEPVRHRHFRRHWRFHLPFPF